MNIRDTRGVRAGAAVVLAALLAGCSGGTADGEGAKGPEGLTAAEACGGFASDAPVAAALEAVVGGEHVEDDRSRPDRAIERLRDDAAAPWADSYRPQPVRYCGLRAVDGGRKGLRIEVRAAGKGPYLGPDLARSVTSYATGREAFASSGSGRLYFSCRLGAPALPLVVEAVVRGPADVPQTDLRHRTRLITLANAAARQVSAKLGCEGDGLATGVPKTVPAPSSAQSPPRTG
ncbi:hypothetical protein ACGFZH_16330 [Streptomyces zaomyceticus]|uniref:hypothetical protein n=1 Tax=Streptomyces zaomyceticus TaxID=68286 RepID=UPI003712761C